MSELIVHVIWVQLVLDLIHFLEKAEAELDRIIARRNG